MRQALRAGLSAGIFGLVPTYDTRYGTATDGSGWITFGLRGGCRQVWLDSSGGNDGNNGLSFANRKATFDAAMAVFTNGSYTAGDQLLIAGTGGRTYTDNYTGSNTLRFLDGFSATYPTAAMSFDPADPTNAALYGKLTGANTPVINGGESFVTWGNTGTGRLAFQGLEFNNSTNAASSSLNFSDRHDDLIFQNCRFNRKPLLLNNVSSAAGRTQRGHVSKSSFWGGWATDGNISGMFCSDIDGLWRQDLVLVHCGWKMGAARGDSAASGGPNTLGHGCYYGATCLGGYADRIVCVDSASDGHNNRGGVIGSAFVALDEPIAGQLGGWSGSYLEAPSGVLITVDDWLVMGGADISSGAQRGYGFPFSNTNSGSYVKKAAMFDNPELDKYFVDKNDGPTEAVDTYMLFDQIRGYNYGGYFADHDGTHPAKSHMTVNNSIIDVSVAGYGSNNSISGAATFPDYKTRSQVYTAMGFGSKAALVNAMLWEPHKPWAQALITIGLPSVGLRPTYRAVAPPDMTGITPATIY